MSAQRSGEMITPKFLLDIYFKIESLFIFSYNDNPLSFKVA